MTVPFVQTVLCPMQNMHTQTRYLHPAIATLPSGASRPVIVKVLYDPIKPKTQTAFYRLWVSVKAIFVPYPVSCMSIHYRTHPSNSFSFGQLQRRLGHGPGEFVLREGYTVCRAVGVPILMIDRNRPYLLQ